MEAISTNDIRLENLKAAAEMRRAELMAIRQPLSLAIAKVINDAIAASGSTKYALRSDGCIIRDFEYMAIDGKDGDDRLVSIDLYYRHDTWEDRRNGKPRVLAFNTCGFGTVKAGDTKGVAYCLLVGYLAAHLQEIQDALNAIPDWEAYERARRFYDVSSRELMEFERKLADEAKTARHAEIEKRLVVGAVVATQKVRKYDFDKRQSFYTGVSTMEVERVTAKLVFFKDAYRQYKKADVLNFLATGLEKRGWSFAADVDMTQFPCPVEA
jgi:hypothetical protein